MNTTSAAKEIGHQILVKDYRWSLYAFIVNIISLTLFNGLVILLMLMHHFIDSEISIKVWVFIVVGIILEVFFVLVSYLDARKRNPRQTLFNSRMFNMPIFVLTIAITIAIFWNNEGVYPIVYGGVCGGFAGYLAGGLAYGNFFIKVKDEVFRTIFGGWIGVVLGAIAGSIFAFYVDPFGGVFGGIFMGFWGGAIVSGPIAVILLHFLRKNEKFTVIFTKLHQYGTIKEVTEDLADYLETTDKDSLDTKECAVFKEIPDKEVKFKEEEDATIWKKILRGLIFIIFLIIPWTKDQDESRREAFTQIFAIAAENNQLSLEEGIISQED